MPKTGSEGTESNPEAYVTSRPVVDSVTPAECWFNMWSKKLWPYKQLMVGDTLFWYESASQKLVWETRVTAVDKFQYGAKDEAKRRIEDRFGEIDENQTYFVKAPNSGFCLAWRVVQVKQLDRPKRADFRFPRQGWKKMSLASLQDYFREVLP